MGTNCGPLNWREGPCAVSSWLRSAVLFPSVPVERTISLRPRSVSGGASGPNTDPRSERRVAVPPASLGVSFTLHVSVLLCWKSQQMQMTGSQLTAGHQLNLLTQAFLVEGFLLPW